VLCPDGGKVPEKNHAFGLCHCLIEKDLKTFQTPIKKTTDIDVVIFVISMCLTCSVLSYIVYLWFQRVDDSQLHVNYP